MQSCKKFSRKFFFSGCTVSSGPGSCCYRGFTITLRPTTRGRSSLDDLWTRPYNTQHSKETYIHVFDGIRTRLPSKRAAQTHILDHAATRIKLTYNCSLKFFRGKFQLIFLFFWVYTKLYNIAQSWNYVRITFATCELFSCLKKFLKL